MKFYLLILLVYNVAANSVYTRIPSYLDWNKENSQIEDNSEEDSHSPEDSNSKLDFSDLQVIIWIVTAMVLIMIPLGVIACVFLLVRSCKHEKSKGRSTTAAPKTSSTSVSSIKV